MSELPEPRAVTDSNTGLPVGPVVGGPAAIRPVHTTLRGRFISTVPVDADAHSRVLFETTSTGPVKYKLWQYMLDGPWESFEAFHESLVWKACCHFQRQPVY